MSDIAKLTMQVNDQAPQWFITRRDHRGKPTCTLTVVGGVRLQVYRHIAHPDTWTAYAHAILSDVMLVAKELDEAQSEALTLLRFTEGSGTARVQDCAKEVALIR